MAQRPIPAAWPSLLALALVVALSIASLAVDLYIDRQTADRTSELVDNSLTSIALADDLRYQAYRLSAPDLDPARIASIANEIAIDARAYDPIATDEGERDECRRLQGLLAHIEHDGALHPQLLEQISASITHLVEINRKAAQTSRDDIRDAHRNGIWIDTVVIGSTLLLAGVVALLFLRLLRRQRELMAVHLASLDERANDLEAFAARTSHDLKGPLSPLRGYSDMLAEDPSPRVRELASRIRRAVDRMTGIVDELLSLSTRGKALAGKVGLRPVVLELLEELERELADAEVAVAVGDCATACSASTLALVLRNLISNAAKYRAEGRRLTLRIEARTLGDRVEILVVDNGAGMDPDVAARAFEPYFRADPTAAPGHGLGLSIVKRAVTAVGGSCSLTSLRGNGTRVTVQLPAA